MQSSTAENFCQEPVPWHHYPWWYFGRLFCVQEHCCHPGKETLALLVCTSQWLKSSGWPAGMKMAVALQALGEHQAKFRASSTACPGRTHSPCHVHCAGVKGECWHLLSGDWQDHLENVATHPCCGNAIWYPVPWFMSEYPNRGVVQVLKCYQKAPSPPTVSILKMCKTYSGTVITGTGSCWH